MVPHECNGKTRAEAAGRAQRHGHARSRDGPARRVRMPLQARNDGLRFKAGTRGGPGKKHETERQHKFEAGRSAVWRCDYPESKLLTFNFLRVQLATSPSAWGRAAAPIKECAFRGQNATSRPRR